MRRPRSVPVPSFLHRSVPVARNFEVDHQIDWATPVEKGLSECVLYYVSPARVRFSSMLRLPFFLDFERSLDEREK